ncbi:MAG: methyltransferase domain-containing protein, partial [Candidatus Nanoarchaeia archaeon]
LDMGTGSGWLAAYLAYIVGPTGQIITYEKNKAFAKLAMNNFSSLGLNNIKLKIKDAYKGFLEKDADVITIDLPNPERVLKFAHRSLKANGILVAYLPQITQILKLVKNLKKAKFLPYKIVECFERNWIIKGQIARPEHDALSHTAFILFAKKI